MINPLEAQKVKNWIFPTKILTQKYKTRSSVITQIIQKAKTSKILKPQKSLNFTFQDEKNLIFLYSKLLFKTSNTFFSNSPKVQLISISLFRRFYLKNSLMKGNPILVLNTAIILAAKIGEIDISAKYGKILKEFKMKSKGSF